MTVTIIFRFFYLFSFTISNFLGGRTQGLFRWRGKGLCYARRLIHHCSNLLSLEELDDSKPLDFSLLRGAFRASCITLYNTKIPLCIPFLGIARPQSQFPHSCVCEHLYNPRIGQHIYCSRIGISIVGIYKSLTDTWIWNGDCAVAVQFLFWEYLFPIFGVGSF